MIQLAAFDGHKYSRADSSAASLRGNQPMMDLENRSNRWAAASVGSLETIAFLFFIVR